MESESKNATLNAQTRQRAAIQFLHPGTFGHRLEGVDTFKTIDMGALGEDRDGAQPSKSALVL